MDPDTFFTDSKGNPVLSKLLQAYISRLMRQKVPPWILLCDVGPIPGLNDPPIVTSMVGAYSCPEEGSPTPAEAADRPQKNSKKLKDPTPHLTHIRNLQKRQPAQTVVEKYGSGYQDYLQVPLQPLTDNLESMTYEVFEKDPIKYEQYELAIRRALRDWIDHGKATSSPDGKVVVAVAGAGRGPLVTRALRASEAEGVEIELWAVEKNPNAYVLLQRHNEEDWQGRVNVVQSDMRSWKGPWREKNSFLQTLQSSNTAHTATKGGNFSTLQASQPAQPVHTPIDILISELLGSFADNELSPECLDGIIHLLNPTHGLSIPTSYTAFLTPIAAPKLHADIISRSTWDATAPETPSVVWLHAIDYLSTVPLAPFPTTEKTTDPATKPTAPAPPQPGAFAEPIVLPTWSFNHTPILHPPPTPFSNTHNTRYARLDFPTRDRGVCHGLAGYFESVLYADVELSTNPNTMEKKSDGMISWFPIFFPLKVCFCFSSSWPLKTLPREGCGVGRGFVEEDGD